MYLLNLNAQILSNLWRIDRKYLLRAADFFELRTRIYEGELQSIRELALIYYKLGREDKSLDYGLKLINSTADFLQYLRDEDVRLMNISLIDILDIIDNIYIYNCYRESKPVTEYVKYFNDEFWTQLDKIFWLFFGNIFAKTCNMVRKSTNWNEISWSSIFKQNKILFIEFLPLITKRICEQCHDSSVEKRIDLMTEAIINLPDIALLETSREVGYLAGYYGAILRRKRGRNR